MILQFKSSRLMVLTFKDHGVLHVGNYKKKDVAYEKEILVCKLPLVTGLLMTLFLAECQFSQTAKAAVICL